MTFKQIKQAKLADVIERELEKMILEGSFVPGQQLPAERELAKSFDVSRPSLREAIQKLETKGLLSRKQGGGTFVQAQLAKQVSDPLFELLNKHPESQYDLLEFRHAFEGISAFYAAMRGTPADFEQLQAALDAIETPWPDPKKALEQEAEAVANFYTKIAEAAHNVVFLHLMRSLSLLLIKNIQDNLTLFAELPSAASNTEENALTKEVIASKIRQHRASLVSAIIAGEPEKARTASHDHLAYIEELLLAISQQKSRVQRTLRRETYSQKLNH